MTSPERNRTRRSQRQSPDQAEGKPDVLARLEQAVGEIQDSESFRAYLDVQSHFHSYSWGNVALILAQRPDATRVAGYNAWLKLHRYVKKGERGIKIIVPMRRKAKEGEEEAEPRVFFGTGTVFDISQTDGEPLPEVHVPVLDGEEGKDLFPRLAGFALARGVSVRPGTKPELAGDTMGFYVPDRREIVVRPASPLQMTKTLAHELAHHLAADDRSNPESETIAESVAYVVLAHFGLDSGARSFPYIAAWSKDRQILQAALGRIQKLSATIIDGIEGAAAHDATTGPGGLEPLAAPRDLTPPAAADVEQPPATHREPEHFAQGRLFEAHRSIRATNPTAARRR